MNKNTEKELVKETIESYKAFRRLLLLIIFVSLLAFIGCRVKQKIVKETIHDSVYVTEIQRDTTLVLMADSAIYRFSFECDSLNQVLMTEVKELKSGNKVKIKYKYIKGELQTVYHIPTEEIKIALKDRVIKYLKEHFKVEKQELKNSTTILKWVGIVAIIMLFVFLLKKLIS